MVPYPAVEFLFQQAMFHTFWFGIKKIVSDEKQTVAVYLQAGYPGVNRILSEKTTGWLFGCSVVLFNLIVVVLVRNQKPSHLQRAGKVYQRIYSILFIMYPGISPVAPCDLV